jgi:hypothetical protein
MVEEGTGTKHMPRIELNPKVTEGRRRQKVEKVRKKLEKG